MRRRYAVLLFAAAACGLGLVGTETTSGPDAAVDGGDGRDASKPICANLNAPCLGKLDPIWQPIALGPACPASFEVIATVSADAKTTPTSCSCGACQPTGAFSCPNFGVKSGDSCNDNGTIASGTSNTCVNTSASQHLNGIVAAPTGTVSCAAPNDAGTNVGANTLTLCAPTSCSVDFCGGASKCVVADGEQTCPTGLTLRAKAGDLACPPCNCASLKASGSCSGVITAFTDKGCPDGGQQKTYPLNQCNNYHDFANDFSSVRTFYTPPTPTCGAPTSDGGASLTNVRTICCLP
jgi:hypothetical protein